MRAFHRRRAASQGATGAKLTRGLSARRGPAADIVASKLRLLLVAINPSPTSARASRPFASPTNAFWRLLYESGLTPILITPDRAARLLEFGIGLTSVANRPTRFASEVTATERLEGAGRVRQIACRVQPEVVGLLGPTISPLFLARAEATGVGWKNATICGADVYVLPDPSGRNRSYPGFKAKLRWYGELALRWK